VVTVRFLGVGGALGPTHGEPGYAESRDVGEIVDRVVEQGYGVAQQAAYDFSGDQAQGSGHGPAQDGWAQGWVRVAMVAVAVTTVAMRVTVIRSTGGRCLTGRTIVSVIMDVIVRVRMHRCQLYSTCLRCRNEVYLRA
jgi:hypothetical protein